MFLVDDLTVLITFKNRRFFSAKEKIPHRKKNITERSFYQLTGNKVSDQWSFS